MTKAFSLGFLTLYATLASYPSIEAFSVVSTKHGFHTKVGFIQSTSSKVPSLYETHSNPFQKNHLLPPKPQLYSVATTADESSTKKTTSPVLSTLYLVTMDVVLRKVFKKASISFPSSLAGCGALFATLLAVNQINVDLGEKFYNTLSSGAAVLAKWLPVFFVPSLVTLPLAPSMGSAAELAKIAMTLIIGFYFTLLTTSWSVLAVRKIGGNKKSTESTPTPSEETDSETTTTATNTTTAKKFSDATMSTLSKSTLACAALAIATTRAGAQTLSVTFQSLFMLSTTLATFVFGARLPGSFTKIVHPLVTCTSFTWIGAKLMSLFIGGSSSFTSMLKSYKTGSLSPFHSTGAGDVLLFMLGPAVVALACQMYDRKTLMKENIKEVGTAVVGSSIGGLFGTAALVRVLNLANPLIRLSTLSRNITSPLAMAIASMLQADVSLAVSMVVISGLIGANFGAMILDSFQIKDPVARGLGVGAASHGLGTAAFANEKDAFPFAAIAMALTASFSTILVSIPMVKKALIKLALGGV